MKRLFAPLLLFCVLYGCNPTQTPTIAPTAVPSAVPTEAPEPTPTQETVTSLDCRLLTFTRVDFPQINNNDCMIGAPEITRAIPDRDGVVRRYQSVPPGYTQVIRLGDQQTPPFVNYVPEGTSTRPRGYEIRIDSVNGHFGFGIAGLLLRGGQRYILKVTFWSALAELQPSAISLNARLYTDGGGMVMLPAQGFNLNAPGEIIWIIESDEAFSTVLWQAYLNVTWAAAAGTFTFQAMSVLEAPAGFGDNVLIRF